MNYCEDISHLIQIIESTRWKIFQVLEIIGQNNDSVKDLLITKDQFKFFVERHKNLDPIAENNDAMIESYVMIDPIVNEINYNYTKFLERGGLYEW